MKNLQNSTLAYACRQTKNGDETLIVIKAEGTFSVDSVFFDKRKNQLILAAKIYTSDGLYHNDYLFLDEDGALSSVLREEAGIMPSLLAAPDGSPWVCLTSPVFEDAKELVLPIEDRKRVKKVLSAREFPSSATLCLGDQTLLYSIDYLDDEKPDRICRLSVDKDGLFKQRKIAKVEAPTQCKPLLDEDGLHLIAFVPPNVISHRLVSAEGEIRKTREYRLESQDYHRVYPINPSFEKESVLLLAQGPELKLCVFGADGKQLRETVLYRLDGDDDVGFYNVFDPVLLPNGAFFVQFNSAALMGHIVVQGEKTVGGMLQEYEDSILTRLQGGDSLDLGAAGLSLTQAVGLSGNRYAMIFSVIDPDLDSDEIKILVRPI